MSLLVIFVAFPMLGAFLLPIMARFLRGGFDKVALFITAMLSAAAFYLVLNAPQQTFVYPIGSWKIPIGIAWLLDPLTILMLLIVNVITFLIVLYSYSYMKLYTGAAKYYTLFLLMLVGLNGVIISGDLFNLFVFLEITAIASYALVAFGTEAEEIEASFKYMVLGNVASGFILIGIAFLYMQTSTLNMMHMASILSAQGGSKGLLLIATLFIVGFGLKAALVPFHAWLPDAHPSAPAPISAMLSGLVIKTIGIYAVARIFFNIFGMQTAVAQILMVLGGLSMSVGVILAIGQWDFKRLLAYHSISQIGYVVCGLALGTPLGIAGGLFHLLNHSVFKSLLFLNAGSVEYATGTRDLKELGDLQKQMPCTSWTSMVASLSIAGVPPFCGFWSKLIIIFALFKEGRPFYGVLATVVGVITLASFLKVQKYVFYRKIKDVSRKIKEVPFMMCGSMIVFALLCIIIGLFFKPVFEYLLMPAANVLYGGKEYFLTIFKQFSVL